MSLAFAHNWEEAKKDLYRGVLEERIGAFDQYLPVQCSQLMTIRSEDYAIFRLIYLLNPDAPLCYKGQVYGDLEEFGKMLAERPDEIAPIAEEMALNGSLSYFMEFKRYDHSYVSAVESVAERLRHGDKEFAHALRFLLYPQQGFSLDGEIFTALPDLCGWLNGLSDALREEKSEVLVNSKEFLMWIFSLGYEEQLTEWKKLMEKAEWE